MKEYGFNQVTINKILNVHGLQLQQKQPKHNKIVNIWPQFFNSLKKVELKLVSLQAQSYGVIILKIHVIN